MPHAILAQIDALDEAIGNSAALPAATAAKARTYIDALRREVCAAFEAGGNEERVRQAQEQGDADRGGYLPALQGSIRQGARRAPKGFKL